MSGQLWFCCKLIKDRDSVKSVKTTTTTKLTESNAAKSNDAENLEL